MKERYGWETIDALRELSHQVIKFDRNYYEEAIKTYQEMIDKIGEKEAI